MLANHRRDGLAVHPLGPHHRGRTGDLHGFRRGVDRSGRGSRTTRGHVPMDRSEGHSSSSRPHTVASVAYSTSLRTPPCTPWHRASWSVPTERTMPSEGPVLELADDQVRSRSHRWSSDYAGGFPSGPAGDRDLWSLRVDDVPAHRVARGEVQEDGSAKVKDLLQAASAIAIPSTCRRKW